jgi:hypothetical protein
MAVDPQHSRDGASGEELVVRRMPGERDHGSLERAKQRQRERAGGRSGRNRTGSASGVDEPDGASDPALPDPLDLSSHRMIPISELQAQRHHDARDVTPAKDGVAARERK